MKIKTDLLGGVGIEREGCDFCGKPSPIMVRNRDGKVFCSDSHKLRYEKGERIKMEGEQTQAAPQEEKEVTQDKPKTKKEKKVKNATKKATKKTAAPAKAKATKAAGNGNRMTGEEIITVKTKEHTFRGKRVKMFSLLKTGMTTKAAVDALEKAGFGRYSGFLHICKDAGLIAIGAAKAAKKAA
jgi:uncharacterized Zn finger protein (UPF0148 family)